MTARRFADAEDPEFAYRGMGTDALPLFAPTDGEAARDRVYAAFDANKPTVVAALRAAAHEVYRRLGRPVSANDVRHVLAGIGYTGDPRILVSAFPLNQWRIVGETTHDAPGNHARRIRTYRPRGEA